MYHVVYIFLEWKYRRIARDGVNTQDQFGNNNMRLSARLVC